MKPSFYVGDKDLESCFHPLEKEKMLSAIPYAVSSALGGQHRATGHPPSPVLLMGHGR